MEGTTVTVKAAPAFPTPGVAGIRKLSDRVGRIDAAFEAFFSGAPQGCVRLTVGEPDFPTPAPIVAAAKAALDAGETRYIATAGKRELQEAISHKLKSENALDYKPDEITVTVGAKEAIVDAALTLLNAGDELLVLAPCWHSYPAIAAMADARAVPVAVNPNNFHPDLEAIKKAVTPRTKAIMVNSPNNPTGAVYTKDELRGIADIAVDKDLYIISDEIYEHLVFGGHHHVAMATLPGAYERTVTINGFSKSFAMTGWRMGYTAAPLELARAMRRIHMHAVTHPSSFQHTAAAVALRECMPQVHAMVAEFDRRRKFLYSALTKVHGWKIAEPEGAFYALPNIRGTGLTSASVYDRLLSAGVQMVPGHLFPLGEGFMRISYATSMEELDKAVGRIRNAFP